MDSLWFLVKLLVVKTPLLLKATVSHLLGTSHTAEKWDLPTTLAVTIAREFLSSSLSMTITQRQKLTSRDPGIKGPMWLSKVAFPTPPEDDLRQALLSAIDSLKLEDEQYTAPNTAAVEAEWTGHRPGVRARDPEPRISEAEKYKKLVEDCSTTTTLLYFHGGSHYLSDPCACRSAVANYAKLIGGRVLNVRYRLAPQNPFPNALLDALICYLSLLYPPPDAYHEPIAASSIVIGGDSSGGNISAALLQTILQLHRSAPAGELPTVTFHGERVTVPLPAGVILSSPSMQLTRALRPDTNALWDYLSPPSSIQDKSASPCDVWPAKPPRAHLYCEGSALCHPLVSPLMAASWDGAPPILLVCGEEILADECKVFAQQVSRQGVQILWEQFEAMPHCFALLLPESGAAERNNAIWADFIKRAVSDPEGIKTTGHFHTAKALVMESVDVGSLGTVSYEEAVATMRLSRNEFIQEPF